MNIDPIMYSHNLYQKLLAFFLKAAEKKEYELLPAAPVTRFESGKPSAAAAAKVQKPQPAITDVQGMKIDFELMVNILLFAEDSISFPTLKILLK